MPTTKDVVDNHLKAFGDQDLDGILADYSADAVLFVPDQTLKGIDAIRPFFAAFLAEFAKPGASFSMRRQSFHGDYGYMLWTGESAENTYEFATDTFIVKNGKIVAQSFAAKITAKR